MVQKQQKQYPFTQDLSTWANVYYHQLAFCSAIQQVTNEIIWKAQQQDPYAHELYKEIMKNGEVKENQTTIVSEGKIYRKIKQALKTIYQLTIRTPDITTSTHPVSSLRSSIQTPRTAKPLQNTYIHYFIGQT